MREDLLAASEDFQPEGMHGGGLRLLTGDEYQNAIQLKWTEAGSSKGLAWIWAKVHELSFLEKWSSPNKKPMQQI